MLANPVPYGIHVTGDFLWFRVLADQDFPLVQNKVSKQIQTNVLAQLGFLWSVYFSLFFK